MKKDLRVVKTIGHLQAALLHLLEQKPLEKISISELCKIANVNRGTFYLHFQDIEELFSHYFQEITDDLRSAYYEPYELTNHVIEDMEPHMVRIFHHVKKFAHFYTIVFNRKAPLMYYYDFYDVIRAYLLDSLSLELLPDDTSKQYLASYQANAILGMIIEWVGNNYEQSAEELNEMLMQFSRLGKL